MNLVPCGHSVDASKVEALFGKLNPGQWKIQSERTCPICRRRVEGIVPTPAFKSLIEELFQNADIGQIIPRVREHFREHSLVVEVDPLQELPVPPGRRGTFDLKKNCWEGPIINPFCFEGSHYITFHNTIPGSLFKEISFIGRPDGSLQICAVISDSNMEGRRYIEQLFDVGLRPGFSSHFFFVETIGEVKRLFKILTDNNAFPEEYFQLMKGCVERGHV